MISLALTHSNNLKASVRSFQAKVEVYEASTLVTTYTYTDALKSYTVERVGDESKFYGYGYCQKANVKLRDVERAIHLTTANTLKIYITAVNGDYVSPYPLFKVSEVHRDENTNELSVTAYDAIYPANKHIVNDLGLSVPYSIGDVADACGDILGCEISKGKNLIPLIIGSTTYNATATVEDDTVSVTVATPSGWGRGMLSPIKLKKNTDYVVSGTYSPQNNNESNIGLQRSLDGVTWEEGVFVALQSSRVETSGSFLFNSGDYEYFQFNLYATYSSETETGTTIFSNLQIEEGTEATPYQKYNSAFETSYPEGANFNGDETIRETLDDIAEATQTIYFLNNNNVLVFKKLEMGDNVVLTINKDDYIDLSSKTNRRLTAVCHATELGDNVISSLDQTGTTQYIRDNPFWDMREDIYDLVDNALAEVAGLTINQFDCSWRGHYGLEIGDKIAYVDKEDAVQNTAFILNDVVTYDGFFSQHTQWEYGADEETEGNPSSLGEFLNKTSAKVDKVNQEINLVVEKVEGYDSQFVEFGMDLDGISSKVQEVETNTNESIGSLSGSLETLTTEVNAKMTSEQVSIAIQRELENGVDKVTTSTGFTFNEEGLTVSKTGTEISTTITEDGMTVYKDDTEMLVANNQGVIATDLHAKTYLIIGKNSRIEDIGSTRTGVFWIGG